MSPWDIWQSTRPLSRLARLCLWGGLIALVITVATLLDHVPIELKTGTGALFYALPIGLGETMPRGVSWGAFAGGFPDDMKEFEQRIGKRADREMVFAHFGNDPDFPMKYARIRDENKTMVLFWEALDYDRSGMEQPEYSFDAVLRGDLDNYFRHFAEGARTYGGPIVLIPYSEMNGNWFPWGGRVGNNSAEKYIAAYRHIHSFFVDVPNVKFGWAVNARDVPEIPGNRFENFYPGDQFVDEVGVDGFDFGAEEARSFEQLFGGPLERLKQYKKPIYIFSMGAAADPHKPLWITDALTVGLYRHPEVRGWLWFNANKERDWRVDQDPQTLAAFRAALGVTNSSSTEVAEN
jgi:hypothetical protein